MLNAESKGYVKSGSCATIPGFLQKRKAIPFNGKRNEKRTNLKMIFA